jgi:DNA-binding transcriptional LysR family regulator
MAVSSERLQAIRAFLQTVEAGSFSEAARQLGQSKSTIAKAVARLEERLGIRLFQRTTRTLALTEEGRIFRESCARALDELERAEARLAEHANMPVGRLRVALPVLFGRDRVLPILLDLMARHEGLELEALFSNQLVHFIEDNVDLAVRIGALPDTIGLVARKCGLQRTVTCAAPGYLDRRGRPRHIEELTQHDCIGILRQNHVEPWRFVSGGRTVQLPIRARLRLGHVEAALYAARGGAGLAQLPLWLAQTAIESGALESVLATYEPPGLPVNIIWPANSAVTRKLRATIDALASGLASEEP